MPSSKRKEVVPEPSLRVFVWSLVVGALLVAAILGYSLATGYSGYPAAPAAKNQSS
jgi:hypothetical protein